MRLPGRRRAVWLLGVATILIGSALVAGQSGQTATVLMLTPAAPILGQTVTLSATVTPQTAAGVVTFYDDTTIIGSAALSTGYASLSTNGLPPGTRHLWARYSGGSGNSPSASARLSVTVAAVASNGFADPIGYDAVASAGVLTADFNADGFVDVVTLSSAPAGSVDGSLGVLLGGASGSLQLASARAISLPGAFATGDFDGDTHTDVVVVTGPDTIVLFGKGDGDFRGTGAAIPLGVQPVGLAVADFNGDGREDVAALAVNSGVTVALATGGGFDVLTPAPALPNPRVIRTGDFDRDGRPDLVVATSAGPLSLLLGNGDGSFGGRQDFTTVANAGVRALAVADINSDGFLDVAVANAEDSSVTVLAGNGAGGFSSTARYAVPAPTAIAISDLNGDGVLDLIAGAESLSGIDVLFGSDGSFGSPIHQSRHAMLSALVATELNGDGRPDLVMGSAAGDQVRVLYGSTFGLSASPNPATHDQSIVFTATAPADASGTVRFFDGATALGAVPLSAGQAMLTTTALAPGSRTVRADYSGDAIYPPATASTDVFIRSLVEIDLASTQNPSGAFDPVTFIAALFAEGGVTSTPTGTVTFTRTGAGTSESATVSMVGGVARWDKPRLMPGAHTVTATYGGDAAFAGTSQTLTQTVSGAVRCQLNSSPNPSSPGDAVTITADCADSHPQNRINDSVDFIGLPNYSTLADGFTRATVVTDSLSLGTHTLTVAPGPGAPLTHVVSSPLSKVKRVTTASDDGPGSLRSTLASAQAGDIILLAPGLHFTPSTPFVVTKPVTIVGGFSGGTVRFDGQHQTRLFVIQSANVTLRQLFIENGFAGGGNGGSGLAGGGGAAGLGGGVFVDVPSGDVRFEGVIFLNNTASGGTGGNGMRLSTLTTYGSGGGGGMGGSGQNGAPWVGGNGGAGGLLGGVPGFAISADSLAAGQFAGSGTNGGPGAGGGGTSGSMGQPAVFDLGEVPPVGNGTSGVGGYGGGGGGGVYLNSIAPPGQQRIFISQPGFGGGSGGGEYPITHAVDGWSIEAGENGGKGGWPTLSFECFDVGPVCILTSGYHISGGAGGGGAGLGGAIFVRNGRVIIRGSAFEANAATGGLAGTTTAPLNHVSVAGTVAAPGRGRGGAVFASPTGGIAFDDGNSFTDNVSDAPFVAVGTPDYSVRENRNWCCDPAVYRTTFSLTSAFEMSARAGAQFPSPIVAKLSNSNGLPWAGQGVRFEVTGAHFGDGSRIADVFTDANGLATAPALHADQIVGSYVASATSGLDRVELVLNVTAGAVTTTALTAAGGAPRSHVGQPTPLNATVTRIPAGAMNGSVEFLDGVRVLGSAPLSGTTAVLNRRLLSGVHGLRAIYTGDATTAPSTSPTSWLVVDAEPSKTFASAWRKAAGTTPRGVALGSFTAATQQMATIVDHGFSIADMTAAGGVATYPTPDTPTAIAAGDLNGDGFTDVLLVLPDANPLSNQLAIYRGSALGMTALVQYSTNPDAVIETADFDSDGLLDVAVLDGFRHMKVWFGKGDGTLRPGPDTSFESSNMSFEAVVVEDFDQDDHADLIALDLGRHQALLFSGDGAGAFALVTTVANNSALSAMTSGDFDGNGWPDVALLGFHGNVSVFFGPFTPSFSYSASTPELNDTTSAIAAADLDADGVDDLVVTRTFTNRLAVYLSHGDGEFDGPLTIPMGVPSNTLAIAEVTGDRRVDLIALNDDGTVSVLAGRPGTASITWPQPNAILPGTALGGGQLNALASDDGTFVYSPSAGTILPAGLQTLSVTFTPRDSGQAPKTASTQIWVRAPEISWTPAPLDYIDPLGPAQFNASTDVPGAFTYSPPAGTRFLATSTPTLHAHFVPNDLLSWPPVDLTAVLEVRKLNPVITWNPASIPFGFNLGPQQLNATANVPGFFVYTPDDRLVPQHSGPLSVTAKFFPDDAPNYNQITRTATVDVLFVPTTIDRQPATLVACDGQTARMDVAATATTLVYQWRRNGVPVFEGGGWSGTRASTLTMSPFDAGMVGTYDVLVNETASSPASVTIEYAPVVSIVEPGMPLAGGTLSINASRTGQSRDITTLQWQFSSNGTTWVDLAGATADTLTIPNVSGPVHNGFYRVVGTTRCGTNTTAAVQVTVRKNSQHIFAPILPVSKTLTYGDTVTLIGQASSGLPVSYEVMSGPVTIANGQIHAIGSGSYQVKVTQAGNEDFEPAAPSIVSGSVDKAILHVHITSLRRLYGAANPPPQFTFMGFVNGDTPAVVTGNPVITWPASDALANFDYPITLDGELSAANYRLFLEHEDGEGMMHVDPAPLTIRVKSIEKVYGEPTPDAQFEYVGLVLGQTTPANANPFRFLPSWVQSADRDLRLAAGTYTIGAEQQSPNYAITIEPGTLTVRQAPLRVTADNKTRKYGQPNPALTAIFEGLRNGDLPQFGGLGPDFRLETTATAQSPAGTYPITYHAGPGNYAITFVPATLTVETVTLTIGVKNTTKVYGDPNPAFEPVFTGLAVAQDAAALAASLVITTTATQTSDAGEYALTPSGVTSASYVIAFQPGTLMIERAPLAVRVSDETRMYGAPNPVFHVSYSGFVLGQNTGALGGSLTIASPAPNAPAGSHAVTPGGLTSANYAISFVAGSLVITPAPLTIKADSVHAYYGYGLPAFTVQYVGLVAGDQPSTVVGAVVNTTATHSTVPGDYPLTVSGGPANSYTITYVDGTLTIDKAPLTITPNNVLRDYGAPDPAFTVSYLGFVLGQDVSILQGTLQVSTNATAQSPVGIYDLVVSGVSSPLYDITFKKSVLRVWPATLTVRPSPVTKLYGQPNPPFTASLLTYTGFVNGDGPHVLHGTLEWLTSVDQHTRAGQYALTAVGLWADNYILDFKGAPFRVDKAPLIVRANDATKVFAAPNPSFSVGYEGFVLGEGPDVIRGSLSFSFSPTPVAAVGSYWIVPAGLTADNYAIEFVPGTLTITKRLLTVTAHDATRPYGYANPAFTVSYSGFVGVDTPAQLGGSLTFTTSSTDSSPVGEYTVTPAGLTSDRYEFEFVPARLTIAPAPLVVRAQGGRLRSYGDPNPTFSASYEGLVLGEGSGVLVGVLTFSAPDVTADVGVYPVTPGGLTSTNYAISFVPFNLEIEAAPLRIEVDSVTKLFGEPNPAFTLHYGGFRNGDGAGAITGTPGFMTTATELSMPGNYAVAANMTGVTARNYYFSGNTPGTLTILKRQATVRTNPASRQYGFGGPAFTVSIAGLVPGTENKVFGTPTFSTAATAASPVGTYEVLPAGLTSSAYDLVFEAGTLTITPRLVTVTARDWTRKYGLPNPSFDADYSGLDFGQSPSVLGPITITTIADATSPVGTYPIVPSGQPPQNYAVTFVPGTLTITKAAVQLSFAPAPGTRPAYPAGLSADQMIARANVPGTFTYDPAVGTVIAPGCVTVNATFTPADTVNYTGASTSFPACIDFGEQHIEWPAPAPLTYGQVLDASRLNATATGEGGQATGALTYLPAAGTLLEGGQQTLRVTAAPTAYYKAALLFVTIDVLPAEQSIAWSDPAPIRYDTMLSAAQLNAVAIGSGPARGGGISYSPNLWVNGIGLQTLTATAAATNNYKAATASVHIMVSKAPAIVSSEDGGGYRGYYDPPRVVWFNWSSGSRGLDFRVGMTKPAGTPAGSYKPDFVFDDPLGHAGNWDISTHELYYIFNPFPSILSMDRASAVKGSGPVTIAIQGDGFVPSCGDHCPPVECEYCSVDTKGTRVLWNDVELPVTFVSPTEIRATVPPELLASSGVAYLAVDNDSGGRVEKEFFVTDAPTTVESAATATSYGEPLHVEAGSIGQESNTLMVDSAEGFGTVTVATYTSNPGGAFAGGDHFFDVFVRPGSEFTSLTITTCALTTPGDRIFWFDGTAWMPASHQSRIAGPPACVQVTIDDQTSPTLAQLTGTFFAAVSDTVPPVLTMPSSMTIEATGAAGAIVQYTATATDNIDPAPIVACTPGSGSPFAIGTTTVSCTATDRTGHASSGTFVVTVRDTTAPAIGPITTTATPVRKNYFVVTLAVSATDAVDPAPACTMTSVTSSAPPKKNGRDDDDTKPAWTIIAPLTVSLRATDEGEGRHVTYTLGLTCTDAAGNASMTSTSVATPQPPETDKAKIGKVK